LIAILSGNFADSTGIILELSRVYPGIFQKSFPEFFGIFTGIVEKLSGNSTGILPMWNFTGILPRILFGILQEFCRNSPRILQEFFQEFCRSSSKNSAGVLPRILKEFFQEFYRNSSNAMWNFTGILQEFCLVFQSKKQMASAIHHQF